MRSRSLPFVSALVLSLGCSSSDGDGSDPLDSQPASDTADADRAEAPCGKKIDTLSIAGAAVPGSTITLAAHDTKSGQTYDVTWSVPSGKLSATTGATVTWTLDKALALHVAETLTVTAVASRVGCDDDTATLDVKVDWPDAERTIVLFNTKSAGSEDVAKYYAKFRGIADGHRCAVSADDITELPGAAYDAFVDTVLACVETVGKHVQYIVPTWGVPYKVSGRVTDTISATPGKVTVSLDAMLALGARSKTVAGIISNPFYLRSDSMKSLYKDYQPFGALRSKFAGSNLYFMVARIDGADAAAAKQLVDRTKEADDLARAGKLSGTVYVDGNRGTPHPADAMGYNQGEWWIIGVENVFKKLGTYPVVADYNSEEFGTAPAPLTCPDALYYAGWYSFGHYNDAFTWKPGAIGGHLDSCSACDLRGSRDWSAMALRKGITATFGAVNEPYVGGTTAYDLVFHLITHGASFGEAAYEATPLGAWMMVWAGDPLYRPYPKK